jgi:ankyrin repeat protein
LFISYSINTEDFTDDDNLMQKVEECVDQNGKMWIAIHDCIRNNDLEQLMTLLSKHSINLNSFNRSSYGDTFLHSAAKSNNVKMIEYVLQRISPSAKRIMLKMKNNHSQLPSELIATRWTPSIHSLFPLKFRQVVKTVLILGVKR